MIVSEDLNNLSEVDKLKHIYILLHDAYCPNDEHCAEDTPIHHDYSCQFILDLINKSTAHNDE